MAAWGAMIFGKVRRFLEENQSTRPMGADIVYGIISLIGGGCRSTRLGLGRVQDRCSQRN
jgi:hypothetical protein